MSQRVRPEVAGPMTGSATCGGTRGEVGAGYRCASLLLPPLQGRIKTNGLGVIGLGSVLLAQSVQGEGSRKIDSSDIRVETNGRCKIGNRIGPLIQGVIDRAAIIIGREVFGVEADRLIEIGERVIEVAFAEICRAALIQCRGVIRRKLHDLIQILDRQVRLGLYDMGNGTAEIGSGQLLSAETAKLDQTGTAGDYLVVGDSVALKAIAFVLGWLRQSHCRHEKHRRSSRGQRSFRLRKPYPVASARAGDRPVHY